MRLQSLRLLSFRAHPDTSLAFAPKVNLLYGPNGAGKTNILEAVHYLCLSKSFLTGQDIHVVRRGCLFFEVEGSFESNGGASVTARLVCAPPEGKRLFWNGAPLERLSNVVGRLPVVVLSPADFALTAGGPEERRRFLDNTLSQSRPAYLDDLLRYRRALKQRNALLMEGRRGQSPSAATLSAWDEELVQLGARLIARRKDFLDVFASYLAEASRLLNLDDDVLEMAYVTVGPPEAMDAEETIVGLFRDQLRRAARRERERGRTLVGPHLDEVAFRLNGFDIRPYASQGQHRLAGLALRLATFLYLRDRLDETPLLLLDDVFGALDTQRVGLVLSLLQSDAVGQSLLTAARLEPFAEVLSFGSPEHRAIPIVNGSVAASATGSLRPEALL